MVDARIFFHFLVKNNIQFFTGVPDSVLKEFCTVLSSSFPPLTKGGHRGGHKICHIIAANEGGAVALAAGYHLASGTIPLVYMQNAGLGNAVNPLTSLVNKEVYNIPMILLIGWRGEPRKKDEPQHAKEGESLLPMLKALGIPYAILSGLSRNVGKQVAAAARIAKKQNTPYALVVRRETFGI